MKHLTKTVAEQSYVAVQMFQHGIQPAEKRSLAIAEHRSGIDQRDRQRCPTCNDSSPGWMQSFYV